MRLSAIFLLFSLVVAVSYAAPAVEKEVKEVEPQVASVEVTTVVAPVEDEAVTVIPEEGVTAVPAQRDGRQVEDDDDDDAEDDGEEADEEDDDEEEEEEEDEEEAAGARKNVKAKNKTKVTAQESKPVPVLAEGGLEDDEAEDLGINGGRQEGTSDEKASDEKDSDEANDDDAKDNAEDSDEEEEEEDDPEDSNGPTGLVADNEPGSSERGDVEDGPVPQPAADPTQPLAVAVVQQDSENGVNAGPVVPVIVDDPSSAVPIAEASETKEVVAPKETQGKKESKDDDADDEGSDEDEEEEEEEEEEEAAARSEKVSRSEDNEVLFYYPIPQVPEVETPEALL